MNYREAIDWLYSTQLIGIKLGLEAPTRLLRDFLAFPAHATRVIHVAGTNGKGSTCAMIDSLGRGLGLRCGLFTSPHLIDFRERVRVNGVQISEEKTARLLTELREMVSDWDPHPTFFELTLALAMRHFRDSDCDLIALETGMGGRLDATTAVPADVCVLTPISLDHTKWLGSTLTEIAHEKASIAVRGKPLVCSAQEPEAKLEIQRVANQTQASLEFVENPLIGYPIGLRGNHQKLNAALACNAMVAAGFHLSYDVVHHGLEYVDWPGRFERIGDQLILDAAHNVQAARCLVETWKSEFPNQSASVIYGAVEDKASDEMLEILSDITTEFHFVPVNSPRGIPPEKHQADRPSSTHQNLSSALDATSEKLTLLAGSLFLLGEAKALLQSKSVRSSTQ